MNCHVTNLCSPQHAYRRAKSGGNMHGKVEVVLQMQLHKLKVANTSMYKYSVLGSHKFGGG